MSPLLETFANASLRGFRAGGAALPGAMELISTQTVGTVGTVTFSSIPQDFKHIKLVFNANENATTDVYWTFLVVNLNGDYAQNYPQNSAISAYSGSVSAITGSYSSNNNYAIYKNVLKAANPNVTGPAWTYNELWLPNYTSTSTLRTIALRGGLAARNVALGVWHASGAYTQTAAVNSISLRIRTSEASYNNFGNFQSGSSFSLYGYRGA